MKSVQQSGSSFDSSGMVRHGTVFLVFSHAVSISNALFHVVMGRYLSAEEYALLLTLISVFMVFAMPFMALQNTMARYTVAGQEACGHGGKLIRHWAVRVGYFSLLVMAISFVAGKPLSALWRMADARPIMWTGLIIATSAYIPLLSGVLQGRQRFVAMGATSMLWCAVRLALGTFLVVALVPSALMALYAHVCGIAASIIFGCLMISRYSDLKTRAADKKLPRTEAYFIYTVSALLVYALLMNMDVPLARALMQSEGDVVLYSRAAIIARMMVFSVQPLAAVLFAKTAGIADDDNSLAALRYAVLMTVGLTVLAIAGFLVVPQLPIIVFFGVEAVTPQQVMLVRQLSVAVSPLGLIFVLMHFEMAHHRFRCIVVIGSSALLFAAAAINFHNTTAQFTLGFAAANGIALLGMLLVVLMRRGRAVLPPPTGGATDRCQDD